MTQYLKLSPECVQLVESLTPLGRDVEKTNMGRFYEVPVDERWYRHLIQVMQAGETWSDVIMRLVRESQRLNDLRRRTEL